MTIRNQADILIREIQLHESTLYRSIRFACLKNALDNFGSTYKEEANDPKLEFEIFIEKGESEQFMFGAFDNERLIGIVGFTCMKQRKARHRGEVVQVYINAMYRGQNIGRGCSEDWWNRLSQWRRSSRFN